MKNDFKESVRATGLFYMGRRNGRWRMDNAHIQLSNCSSKLTVQMNCIPKFWANMRNDHEKIVIVSQDLVIAIILI